MPVQAGINLLPRDETARLGAKVMRWALTFGRYIVILTELVVIVAFLMRFSLDQRLSDLYDSIKEKQLFVDANSEFETNFRQTQAKLLTIKQSLGSNLGAVEMLDAFAKILPRDVNFKNFSFSDGGFRITAIASSETSLTTFISGLKTNLNLRNVTISGVTATSESPGLTLTINGDWKKR